MASTVEINARLDAVEHSAAGSLQKSYHGIAARIDRMPAGRAQRTVLWLAGGICFCDSVDMNIAGPIIAQFLVNGFSDSATNGLFVSITALGYLFGGLIAGIVSDHFGRKKALITFASIFTIAAFLASVMPDIHSLIAVRFLMGLGLGAAYPCGYGAMSEYTPTAKRGRYQAWVGLIANCGSPASAWICAAFLPIIGWRNLFIVVGCLGILMIALVLKFFPESPRWLANHGRNDEADARVTLMENQMRKAGHTVEPVPEEVIAKLEEDAKNEPKELPYSFLFTKKMLPRTIVAGAIQFCNFVCTYTITTWTPTIFVTRGLDVQVSTTLSACILCGIPVGIFVLSMLVDRWGRKPQLIIGMLGSGLFGFIWSMIPVDNIVLIVAMGFFLAAWTNYWGLICSSVYLPEPFPTAIRVRGAGMGNAIGRIGAIASPIWIAALLASPAGAVGVYLVNAGIMIIGACIVGFLAVETTGKSLEEISAPVMEDAAKYYAKKENK